MTHPKKLGYLAHSGRGGKRMGNCKVRWLYRRGLSWPRPRQNLARTTSVVIACVFVAFPVWPQSFRANVALCNADDPNSRVRGCAAVSQSDQSSPDVRIWALLRLSDAQAQQGLYGQAIADDDEAISIDPNSADAYETRAQERIALDGGYPTLTDRPKIQADAFKAASLAPANPNFAYLEGQFEEDDDRSIADYERAVALNPRFSDAYIALAQEYQGRAFESQKAIEYYQAALRIDPTLKAASDGIDQVRKQARDEWVRIGYVIVLAVVAFISLVVRAATKSSS